MLSIYCKIDLLTGGPSSSCEMIILPNNGHGGIIRVCMGIFTTALRNKAHLSEFEIDQEAIVSIGQSNSPSEMFTNE